MKQKKLTRKQLRAIFAKMNTAQHRDLAHEHAQRLEHEEAAYHYDMAFKKYPKHHPKSNLLMSLQKGDVEIKILKKHPADVWAYRLPRIVKKINLPLKADELRFLAQKRIRK